MPSNYETMGPSPYNFPTVKPPPGYGPIPTGAMINGKPPFIEGNINNQSRQPHHNEGGRQNMMSLQYHQNSRPHEKQKLPPITGVTGYHGPQPLPSLNLQQAAPPYSASHAYGYYHPLSSVQFPPELSPVQENFANTHTQVNAISAPVQYIKSSSPPVQFAAQNYGPQPVFYPQGCPETSPLSGNYPIFTRNQYNTHLVSEIPTQTSHLPILPPPYQATQPMNAPPKYPIDIPVQQYNMVTPHVSFPPKFYKHTCVVTQPYPQQFQFNLYPQPIHGQQTQFNPVLNHCNVQFNTQGPSDNPKPKVSSYEYNGTVYYYYNTPSSSNSQNLAKEVSEPNIKADVKEDNKEDAEGVNLTSARQQKAKRKWKRKNKN